MANLRDIINAATPGPWESHMVSCTVSSPDGTTVASCQMSGMAKLPDKDGWTREAAYSADAAYIAAYSPDHALLIEAVIGATRAEIDCDRECDGTDGGFCSMYCQRNQVEQCWAIARLVAYRKERGYE